MNTLLTILLLFDNGLGILIKTLVLYLYITWFQYLALVKNELLIGATYEVTDPDGIKILHVSALLITPLAYIMYIC